MVDVGEKAHTRRRAVAAGRVRMGPGALALVQEGGKKGDAIAVARIAGIQGAKRTADLIPLCHPMPLEHVRVDVVIDAGAGAVVVEAEAVVTHKTGVEMEALTAVAVACLAVIDMVKGVDRGAHIECIELVSKEGGRSGRWTRGQT
jgi:cyclic pyranopterin phosphate synthase